MRVVRKVYSPCYQHHDSLSLLKWTLNFKLITITEIHLCDSELGLMSRNHQRHCNVQCIQRNMYFCLAREWNFIKVPEIVFIILQSMWESRKVNCVEMILSNSKSPS